MPHPLVDRLRARGFVAPDYDGGGLVNVPATVLDVLGARVATDAPALTALDPALCEGVRQVVVVLADGLGWWQLEMLCDQGDTPFLAELRDRARRRDQGAAHRGDDGVPIDDRGGDHDDQHRANAARARQHRVLPLARGIRRGHGDAPVGPRGDASRFVLRRPRRRPRPLRPGAVHPRPLTRARHPVAPRRAGDLPVGSHDTHARVEASFVGYVLPSSMGVRLRALVDDAPRPSYVYAYWSGIDTVSHLYGPRSEEAAMEAALFDLDLRRALGHRPAGDTLVLLTADHGHATTDPDKMLNMVGDEELRSLLRNPPAGEPRLVFLHTDRPAAVREYIDRRWPGLVTLLDRDELIDAGLFGRGDSKIARRRIGEVVALLDRDLSASIVKVEGQTIRHRGSHGGMSADEMRIPILAWRA
jgi:hypothetical protein